MNNPCCWTVAEGVVPSEDEAAKWSHVLTVVDAFKAAVDGSKTLCGVLSVVPKHGRLNVVRVKPGGIEPLCIESVPTCPYCVIRMMSGSYKICANSGDLTPQDHGVERTLW